MISFHPSVRRDAVAAFRFYDRASSHLADEFWACFEAVCAQAAAEPRHFHFDASGWRRANLKKFPYHILFYEELEGVRVMVLRHNRRNSKFGSRRR